MSRDGLPPEVMALILDKIVSIEQMEILLLLAADPARAWTADEISRELRGSPRSASRWLTHLAAHGFAVENGGRFTFIEGDPKLKATVAELAQCYAMRRVTVIELIFNKPNARLKTFAEAFRIREDK